MVPITLAAIVVTSWGFYRQARRIIVPDRLSISSSTFLYIVRGKKYEFPLRDIESFEAGKFGGWAVNSCIRVYLKPGTTYLKPGVPCLQMYANWQISPRQLSCDLNDILKSNQQMPV